MKTAPSRSILAIFIPTLFLFLFGAGITSAQTGGGNLGGHIGWIKAGDAEDGNFLFGGHVELRPIPWLGVQGSVDYWLAESYSFASGEMDVRSIPVTVTARAYLVATDQLNVFAAAGAGWYFMKYDYSDEFEELGIEDSTESTFGWHVGAGLSVPLSPTVALYGEARAVFLDPDRDIDDDIVDDVGSLDYDSTYLVAGANFKF